MRVLLLVTVCALCGCKKDVAPASAEKTEKTEARAEKEKQRATGKAEVEFFGTWKLAGEVKPAKVIFVAQLEPCAPVPDKPTRLGEAALKEPGPLFAEFFIPQGTVGHACVYGLDETGKVIAVASDAQNPMTFQGEGEVVKAKLDYTLQSP
ncbi:MAG: hypothetical protein JNM17_08690 [Archangium sp.]|nr:hypothetical protein [Archangium sp.]